MCSINWNHFKGNSGLVRERNLCFQDLDGKFGIPLKKRNHFRNHK